jgi:hypothetical protein
MMRTRCSFAVMLLLTAGAFATLTLAALGLMATRADAAYKYIPTAAPTADTLRLSIEDAVTYARTHATQIQNAIAGIDAAEGRVREAVAYALPNIKGSVEYVDLLKRYFRGTLISTIVDANLVAPGDRRWYEAYAANGMVTAGALMPSTHEPSHGAGQTRPVNSGKLFVLWSRSSASRHWSR